MKNRLRAFSLMMVVTLLAFKANAQSVNTDSTVKWSLQDCIKYADDHNYNINSLKLTEATNTQTYLQSKAAQLPSLAANGSMTFNHNGTEFNSNDKFNSTGSAGLNSSWTLYNGGYLQKDKAQKKIAIQSADLQLEQGKNTAALQITQAYLNILLDKETIGYNQDLIKTSEVQLQQAQQQYNVGSLARKNVVQLEAQLATDKYNLVTASSTEKLDRLSLKQLLLLPSEINFEIQKPDTLFSLTVLPPLADVQDAAMKIMPDTKLPELELSSYKLALSKARAGYLPVITLSGGVGTSLGNSTNYSLGYSLNNNLYQQAGVSASLPIFSNRTNKTNVEKAKINIQQANLDLDNAKITLSQTVEKAYLNALNNQNQYAGAVEELKYNQEALRIVAEELRIGSADMVDYIQQRNLYVQALQQYTQAKYNAAMYLKIYEFYKGEPLTLK